MQSSQAAVRRGAERFRELEEALPKRRDVAASGWPSAKKPEELEIDPELLSVEQLDERVAAARARRSTSLSQRMAGVWARVGTADGRCHVAAGAAPRRSSPARSRELSGELLELSLLQARARLDAITFEPVDLTPEEGFCIASRYRRDWMNARAALVDSWRLIHFNANDLESDLDLVFSRRHRQRGRQSVPPAARTNGRLRVGLQFDAPLTRLAERNVYRQSLIEYQQARRQYYQFRDRVQRNVRAHAAAAAARRVELRAAPGGRARGDHAGRPGAAAAVGAGPARARRRRPGSRRSRAASRNSATPWPATWSTR